MLASQHVYSVSELTGEVRRLLEASYPSVWIEGEISNLARPASGHLYFTLKDENSQVRCAFFRGRLNRVACAIEDGMKVQVRAQVSLYENRGDFQLIVSHLQDAGLGNLQAAFEKLKQKLDREGLFSSESKKPLPPYPDSIGVITSATGAVIKDITNTCQRRYPIVKLVLYPVQVQGENAAGEIIRALKAADQNHHDVLIIGRGGGSLEDLWAFNTEPLARAIFSCKTPVISAVGHEVDFTIADFVADVRAPTPTAAAELATPDADQLAARFQQLQKRLNLSMSSQIHRRIQQIDILTYRLIHPSRKLNEWKRLNAQLQERLKISITNAMTQKRLTVNNLCRLITGNTPHTLVSQGRSVLCQLNRQLVAAVNSRLKHNKTVIESARDKLITVSPQSTLERGYAIVTLPPDGTVLRSVHQVKPRTSLEIRLADGRFKAKSDN